MDKDYWQRSDETQLDKYGNVEKKQLDKPISITFKRDSSSMIQKILHSYPMAVNQAIKNNRIENFQSQKEINNSTYQHYTQSQSTYHQQRNYQNKQSHGINERKQNYETKKQQESQINTSEIMAKEFLAQGFQLQDSVKISAQMIHHDVSQASVVSEKQKNRDQTIKYEQYRDSKQFNLKQNYIPTPNNCLKVFDHSPQNKNDNFKKQKAIPRQKNIEFNGHQPGQNQRLNTQNEGQITRDVGSVAKQTKQSQNMYNMRADQQSGHIWTHPTPLSLQTQFILQIINQHVENHCQNGQINMNYINQLIMQTLEKPSAQLDNEHFERIQKLDQVGQKMFQQQSDQRTNSATLINESAQRQIDQNQDVVPIQNQTQYQQNSQEQDHQLNMHREQIVSESHKIQDKQFASKINTQTICLPQGSIVPQTQVANKQSQSKGPLHDELGQKEDTSQFLDLHAPTELNANLIRNDIQTQEQFVNMQNTGVEDRASMTISQQKLVDQNKGNKLQIGASTNFSPIPLMQMTQTQIRSRPNNNLNQQRSQNQNVIEGQPNQQSSVMPHTLDEQRNTEYMMSQLLSNSKDLNGLAQLLQSKGIESQLQNLLSDQRDSSARELSSGIACVGSLNTANAINSAGRSGVSPESANDCGSKIQDGPNKKALESKSNDLKDSVACSGQSRNNIIMPGDLATSGVNATNEIGRDESKCSGSRQGSKAGTYGSITVPNGSTDKDTGSNGNGIDKLKELIETFLPTGKQANFTDDSKKDVSVSNNHLVNNMVANVVTGQVQESNIKVSSNDNQVASTDQGAANIKQCKTQHIDADTLNNTNKDKTQTDQMQSLSQDERTHLNNTIENQAKEISQLKTFILVNMLFGNNNVGEEQSKVTQQLIQELMLSTMMTSANQKHKNQGSNQLMKSSNADPTIDQSVMTALPKIIAAQGNNGLNSKAQVSQPQQNKRDDQVNEALIGALKPKTQESQSQGLQQFLQMQSKLLGKRNVNQRSQSGQINDLLAQMNQDTGIEGQNQFDYDQKSQLLKSKLQMLMGVSNQLQDENKLGNQMKEQQVSSADRRQQPSKLNYSEQFNDQKAVSAAKTQENQRSNLISGFVKQNQNSQERQSDLCATFQQGYMESADHQYEGTSAFLRLKAQIKKNMLAKQFSQMKNEIMAAVNRNQADKVLIGEKPKRPHHNMGEDSFRGSKFRGVSKNKCKWQMMIMINQKKVYIGAIHTEVEAAKYYDHIAILTQGLHAKTNFAYTAAQLEQIVNDYDFTNDKDGYFDFPSEMHTSNYGSKHGSKLNQKEINFDNVSGCNNHLSKRQRMDDALNVQESSDENQMISDHLYSSKNLKEGSNSQPLANQINLGDQLEMNGQFKQKIQQLGFESLAQLLNSMQKQKQNQGSFPMQINSNQNIMQALSNMIPSMAGKKQNSQSQPQNSAQNNYQNDQVIQQLLSSYNQNLTQTENEVQNTQDNRQMAFQAINTDSTYMQKSPLLKNQVSQGINGNLANQMILNQQKSNSNLQFGQLGRQIQQLSQFKMPQNQVNYQAQAQMSNMQMNSMGNNQMNYDGTKAIQMQTSKSQMPNGTNIPFNSLNYYNKSSSLSQQGINNGQNQIASHISINPNDQNYQIGQANQSIEEQIALMSQMQMKDQTHGAQGLNSLGIQHLIRNLKFKNTQFSGQVDQRDSKQFQQFGRQQQPIQSQTVEQVENDPYKTPPMKKEGFSSENC